MPSVVILHPDLGIGGAERLIVDIALALKQKNHKVEIVTNHHDPSHCFEETRNGELKVTVVGDWIPRSIFGRCHALMAYTRMILAAMYIVLYADMKPDVVICDLVSVAIPFLTLRCRNVIFYCHHPDQLLSQPEGRLKSIYRAPLNWLEEFTTGKATHVFVNSLYTSKVFTDTFKRLSIQPEVLYPSLNTEFFDTTLTEPLNTFLPNNIPNDTKILLSINRYERKKDLELALRALKKLEGKIDSEEWSKTHLIIAGGYDPRVKENIDYFRELVILSVELGLQEKVFFLQSPLDSEKISLLKNCTCLIYTPTNEHFGIVPIEAMYMGKPVVACNSGGPTETILDKVTGFLCESDPEQFAEAMKKIISSKFLAERLGNAGRQRVIKTFSFQKFATQLDEVVTNLIESKNK